MILGLYDIKYRMMNWYPRIKYAKLNKYTIVIMIKKKFYLKALKNS